MRLKHMLAGMTALAITLSCSGCALETVRPDTADKGVYSTQNSMSAAEYSIYINKQITVYTNQLTTRMSMIQNMKQGSVYENEIQMAEKSLEIMADVLESVTVTKPSFYRGDDREKVILAMETANDNMELYTEGLKNGDDVSGFEELFQNDFNALTGLANLYYE
uniref:hypothetical protein n=1 Tax=Lachnoclostridium phocaeense TaxID=1871021 RepID=UPI0026DD0A34|nr:hypothetical protein [Lachnoclostridium phocaeense]